MKSYTKVYLTYFDLTGFEFIPCEICGSGAVDIHHIYARSIRKDLENWIGNLMGLCRDCHIQYGDKVKHYDFLIEMHSNYLKRFSPNAKRLI